METDNIQDLLFIEREGSYRGYKKTLLSQQMTDFLVDILSCNECDGILREASFSQGRNLCTACCDENAPNLNLQGAVAKLEAKCPLDTRGCEWEGLISEVLEHTDGCGHVMVRCNLNCEEVMPRNELAEHEQHHCPLREVECGMCGEIGQARDREIHADECQMLPLDCPQGCGGMVRRGELEEHCGEVCEMSEMECPFSVLGCRDIVYRKEVQDHVENSVTMHQDVIKNSFVRHDETIQEQNETIKEQNEKISELEDHIQCMLARLAVLERRTELEQVKCLQGVEWRIENLRQLVRTREMVEGPRFTLDVYTFISKAVYYPDMRCIHIFVERINGIGDGKCRIKYLKVILVNRQDRSNPIEEFRNTIYDISIGDKLPLMNIRYPIREEFIQEDSLFVRMFFEVQ